MKRTIPTVLIGLVLVGTAVDASFSKEATPERLIVTTLPDPDPNFVPPREPPKRNRRTSTKPTDPSLDQTMQDLGRIIGAALTLRHAREQGCRPAQPTDKSGINTLANCASQVR